MKQETIIMQKLVNAQTKKEDAIFPTEFYKKNEIINGLKIFDINYVSFCVKNGKTEK